LAGRFLLSAAIDLQPQAVFLGHQCVQFSLQLVAATPVLFGGGSILSLQFPAYPGLTSDDLMLSGDKGCFVHNNILRQESFRILPSAKQGRQQQGSGSKASPKLDKVIHLA